MLSNVSIYKRSPFTRLSVQKVRKKLKADCSATRLFLIIF